ncbi:MAG: hypothetical protein U9O50_05995 [Acidobacteriota bacterium]|nr:hypothetical protein [Acidobacteriota bacterium]
MNSYDYETWSQFWISTTSHYTKVSLESVNQFVTSEKKRVANLVFEHIKPICIYFLNIVVGKTQSTCSQEVSEGVCINRLLGKKALHLLPQRSSQTISQLLQETFLLGVFTHLYFFTFPTREFYKKVDLQQLQQKWETDAIAADFVMGYYGDPKNPVCMELWKYHFNTTVINKLKNHVKIGFFGAGKYKAFFRNIYLAGALLVMEYDLATKR